MLPCISNDNSIIKRLTKTFIVLGHELKHSYDIIFGGEEDKYETTSIEYDTEILKEEYYAVGLDPNDSSKNTYDNIKSNNVGALTENGLRIENNQPLRGRYVG